MALVTAGLAAVPLPWPPADVIDTPTWWATAGTAQAVVSVGRLVGVAIGGWLTLVGALGVVASLHRSAAAVRLWRVVQPGSLRRVLAASVAMSIAAPGIAGATDGPAEPPRIHDLGPADDDASDRRAPVLVDLGPADDRLPAPANPEDGAATSPATWTVTPGDHLWRVAEETLRDRATEPSESEVTAYWRRLIEQNREVIGEDADLIHPGMVLTLPG